MTAIVRKRREYMVAKRPTHWWQNTISLALLVGLIFCAHEPVAAQLPTVSDSRLGVDAIRLVGNKRLYGFVLESTPDSTLLAVERQWLKSTYPKLLEAEELLEQDRTTSAREEVIELTENWIAQGKGDGLLARFLAAEMERISESAAKTSKPSRFIVLELQANQIREVSIARTDRRKIAGISYSHQLENIVITPANYLKKKLQALGVDLQTEQVDLSNELPKLQSQNERQWAARQALIEFQYLDELIFQGTGDTLIRKGADEADIGALLGQALGNNSANMLQQLGAELGLPEFAKAAFDPQNWIAAVSAKADSAGARGALVSRLNQNLLSPEVVVETAFIAKDNQGEWFKVFEHRSSANANQQSPESVNRIKQDPQVQKLLAAFGGLGLNFEERLEQALRHGAATQKAMKDGEAEFNAFLSKYGQHLDGPPVPLVQQH